MRSRIKFASTSPPPCNKDSHGSDCDILVKDLKSLEQTTQKCYYSLEKVCGHKKTFLRRFALAQADRVSAMA